MATATFTAGADRSNRQATVSVKSGSATGTVVLDVVGTVLSYSGVTTVPLNGVATLPIKAVDSRGTPIAGSGDRDQQPRQRPVGDFAGDGFARYTPR